MKNTMHTTWETRIEPIETAVLITPSGRMEAERIKTGLLSCGCYAGACYCGQYPTFSEICAMKQEAQDTLPERIPATLAEEIETEELRNFFGRRSGA